MAQKYQSTHSDGLKAFTDTITEESELNRCVKAHVSGAAPAPTGATVSTGNRTNASPEWGGDGPVNFQKRLQLTGVPMSEFTTANTFLGRVIPFFVAVFPKPTKYTNVYPT